jgi:hypothetical protein
MDSSNQQEIRPERVVTNWRRFSMGLWRVPPGDIFDAYSADTMPKVSLFIHEGRWFTNGGSCFSKLVHSQTDGYWLIPPDEYRGPESIPYSYEGREVTCQRKTFRLGPKIQFVASDPTVDEWRRLLRCVFADGGMFTFDCTYPEFITGRHAPDSENGRAAASMEVADCSQGILPVTKNAMIEWLDAGANPIPPVRQLDLGF